MDPVTAFLLKLQQTMLPWAVPLAGLTIAWIGFMLGLTAWTGGGGGSHHSRGWWVMLLGPILIGWAPILGPWIAALHP